MIGQRRPGTLPLPEYLGLTPASDHDLATFRQIAPYIQGGEIYLDKAYVECLAKALHRTRLATPRSICPRNQASKPFLRLNIPYRGRPGVERVAHFHRV